MGVRTAVAVCCALFGASLVGAPAQAAFPGQNGKLVFYRDADRSIATINPDGSAYTPFGLEFANRPTWSPDGQMILFDGVSIEKTDANGSTRTFVYDTGTAPNSTSWSPDGTQIAIGFPICNAGGCVSYVIRIDADGSNEVLLDEDTTGGFTPYVSWSADGRRIAFQRDLEIWLVNPDGTGKAPVPNASGGDPDWSPDASRLAFQGLDGDIHTIKPDGTGLQQVTSNPAFEQAPAWSPDGSRIAFMRQVQPDPAFALFTITPAGTGEQPVTTTPGNDQYPDWQPLPVNSYPRPRGTTPIQVSMVPAYALCTSPNRTHGPPLAFPSCASPTQASDELTVGTPDANAKPAKSRGTVRYDAIAGAPATPTDEADVQIAVELFDIYEQGTLADYTGELRANVTLRITDKLNTPHPGGPGAATVTDASLGATVPCTATADTTEGATCNLVTTFDALVPGTVTEIKRSIWALGPAQLQDGGADNDADTTGDNTLFMTQGLFVP